jgi:hypothetical protein
VRFALLTVMGLLSGLAGLLGTRLVVDSFRGSAVRAEQEATTSARLRVEVVAHSILVTSPITVAQQRQLVAAPMPLPHVGTARVANHSALARNVVGVLSHRGKGARAGGIAGGR